MTAAKTEKLIIGISSRALFDLDASHEIFTTQGVKAYAKHQRSHENDPLKPGSAFDLVQKLLNLTIPNTNEPLVEVILLSRNSSDTGLRIFNSIHHHNLAITRAAFTSGSNPYQYVRAFGSHLFLSTEYEDVARALETGCAAATIYPTQAKNTHPDRLHIAFDGDAVLFSPESERIYHEQGLESFEANESKHAEQPLADGPFKGFLTMLHKLQQHFDKDECPIRTALVTARSAPAHERVIRTLREWDIRIDEALFLGGMKKGAFLNAFQADIFFDDKWTHCESAKEHVTTGHVPIE